MNVEDYKMLAEHHLQLAVSCARKAKILSEKKNNPTRLKHGELPVLILSILSEDKDGIQLKRLTQIIWDRGYRTRSDSKKSLYQTVYQACSKMIGEKSAIKNTRKYTLTKFGLEKAAKEEAA
ncbi:MAG: hypothetical protein ACW99G_02765 [Candidatus Thorarchaeota archaeon]